MSLSSLGYKCRLCGIPPLWQLQSAIQHLFTKNHRKVVAGQPIYQVALSSPLTSEIVAHVRLSGLAGFLPEKYLRETQEQFWSDCTMGADAEELLNLAKGEFVYGKKKRDHLFNTLASRFDPLIISVGLGSLTDESLLIFKALLKLL